MISRWASDSAAPTERNLTRFTAMIQQAHPRFQASAWRLDPARFAALFAAATTAPTPDTPAALSGGPSIAVLPFQNMSGNSQQEYFVDGMVEEIITALSRIRWLLVLARNSSFTYKGHAVDVKQVGRKLGVRYVLEGSVRKEQAIYYIGDTFTVQDTNSRVTYRMLFAAAVYGSDALLDDIVNSCYRQMILPDTDVADRLIEAHIFDRIAFAKDVLEMRISATDINAGAGEQFLAGALDQAGMEAARQKSPGQRT